MPDGIYAVWSTSAQGIPTTSPAVTRGGVVALCGLKFSGGVGWHRDAEHSRDDRYFFRRTYQRPRTCSAGMRPSRTAKYARRYSGVGCLVSAALSRGTLLSGMRSSSADIRNFPDKGFPPREMSRSGKPCLPARQDQTESDVGGAPC